MKLVQILMSTYNGERYLREQMDSILHQDCEEGGTARLSLLVRDDGSTDTTRYILQEYEEKYPEKVVWYRGENQGVVGSFFDLLRKSCPEADYIGFADQDDYWLPEKVRAGVEHLEREDVKLPALYCCRCTLADEHLQPLASDIRRPPVRPAFGNALVENVAAGCTILMNRTLREMLVPVVPGCAVMHDWWCYLVASCFGHVYFDEHSYILYRQHGKNAVGSNASKWKELAERIKRYRGNRGNISRQVEEFLRIYQGRVQAVPESGRDTLEADCLRLAGQLLAGKNSLAVRWKLVCSHRVFRQRQTDDWIFRLIVLLGSY